MTPVRTTAWILLAALGYVLLPGTTRAQEPKLPSKDNTAIDLVNTYKEGKGIPPAELKKARDAFASFAKYYADIVVHPTVYKAQQDPKIAVGTKIPTIDRDPATGIFKELDRFLLEPNPSTATGAEGGGPKITVGHADYIREMGVGFDAALKPIIETNPERIIKVNATRLLAEVCRTGASAHYPTVTGLLANPNTPTEIKYYALQAAGNLLAAYDVTDFKSRRHSILYKNDKEKGTGDKDLGELVKAVERCVLDPAAVVSGVTGGKAENMTPDQLAVFAFVRRQAVRTLGEVRVVMLPGPNPKETLYPSYTLARVCLSDPALVPPPTPAECADAAIGLCRMAPAVGGNQIKAYNGDAAVEAVAAAMVTFATPRSANPLDRSVPWRGYAARLIDAFRAWPPLFDPAFDPLNPTKVDRSYTPKVVTDTLTSIQTMVLAPIDKTDSSGKPDLGARVDIEGLKGVLKALRERPKRNTLLFTGVPGTTIVFP